MHVPTSPCESNMEAFEYTPLQGRVVFGHGTLERIAEEMSLMGCSRAFVLSDGHHEKTAAARILGLLGDRAVGLSTDAVMHTPIDVTEQVEKKLQAASPDCLIALGGGSTTGLSKALAWRTGLPQNRRPNDLCRL
jgi:maleylacetate reductase